MKDLEFTVSDIRELMEAFDRSRLSGMKLSQGGLTLVLESRSAIAAAPVGSAPAMTVKPAEPAEQVSGNLVKAPIVGTFYAASAPDKEPYVTVGSKVKKGDVLFIIESMKLMNEVVSDFDGNVTEILVQNGLPVEYGQPILTIM